MHLVQHKLCKRKTKLAVEMKFYLHLRRVTWWWRRTLTNGSDVKNSFLCKALFKWEKVVPGILYNSKRAFTWQITTCLGEEGDPGGRVTRLTRPGNPGCRANFSPRKHTLTRVGGPTRNTDSTGYVFRDKTTWRRIRRSQHHEWKDGLFFLRLFSLPNESPVLTRLPAAIFFHVNVR